MQLLRDVFALIRSWWQVDRVRISPAEGRLLRLIPPCIICVNGRPVEVLRRSVSHETFGPIVQYDCLCQGQAAQLLVATNEKGRTSSVVWFENGQVRDLTEADVDAYGNRGTYRNSIVSN